MNVLLFGATGMVGQGVLRECLLDPDVQSVKTIGRTATGVQNPKLRDIVHPDLWNYSTLESELGNLDACFFCLGIASAGMTESAYERVTCAIPVAAAKILSKLNPNMTFIFVSGAGTDSSERGRIMWARIKGKAENILIKLPFRGVYAFRPAIIRPLHGAKSKTKLYRFFYALTGPILPLLGMLFPNHVTTTERIGQAMLRITRKGFPKTVLESRDINTAADF